jgi:(2R)-3-sulfolactate dehydrogenase (NADP+)
LSEDKMSAHTRLSLAEIEDLARRALMAAGAAHDQAAPLAVGIMQAERDGIASHGLMYLPVYVEHLHCGKVDGTARPCVEQPRPGTVRVDAATGFAHAAIDAGMVPLLEAARANGIACMAVRNSYNCGVLGHHAERIAETGLVGLCFTNAPASIAPLGGTRPVIGTNPFALAAPGADGQALLVVDQSASVVAKSEVVKRARAGKPIPEGWVLDAGGRPTTDPQAGLKGSMAPAGGYKGVGLGLLVEVFAAALSGAELGIDAAPFSGREGGPPRTGQFFIAVDPDLTSGGRFAGQVSRLAEAITAQPGTRLPGRRRFAARAKAVRQGVEVDSHLLEQIAALK